MAKSSKKKLEKELKKVHKATLIFVVVFALLGVAAGYGVGYFLTKDDVFKLNGQEQITLSVGDTYQEDKCTIIAFGKDISDQVIITGEVETSVEGKYVVKYTVNHFRYAGYTLYRLVTVEPSGV